MTAELARRLAKVAPSRFEFVNTNEKRPECWGLYFDLFGQDVGDWSFGFASNEGVLDEQIIYPAAWCLQEMRKRVDSLEVADARQEHMWLMNEIFIQPIYRLTPLRQLELYVEWRERFGQEGEGKC